MTTPKAPPKVKPSKDLTPFLEDIRAAVLPQLHQYAENLLHLAGQVQNNEKKILRALAIDPGTTNLALCYFDREYGTEQTTKIEIPDALDSNMRIRYVEAVLDQWIWMFRPDVIFKEGVAFGQTHGVAESGKVQYMVERLAIDHRIPYLTITNPSMRSFFKAKDRGATKSDIKLRVFQQFNKEFPSEDETDAFAIGETGFAILEGRYVVHKK